MSRSFSPQTVAVLRALSAVSGNGWTYGLQVSRETRLASGSLYPILMRLAKQGWLEESWEPAQEQGRPPRHLYRLNAAGRSLLASLPEPRIAPRAIPA